MQVRKAAVSDARRVAQIHVASWQAACRGQMPDAVLDNVDVFVGANTVVLHHRRNSGQRAAEIMFSTNKAGCTVRRPITSKVNL